MTLREHCNFLVAFAFATLSACLTVPHSDAQVVRTGWTSLISVSTNKCLDIAGRSTTDGANGVIWPCGFATNEQFDVQPFGSGFRIIEQQTGKCLIAPKNSNAPGQVIVQQSCVGTPNEVWKIAALGNAFQIQSLSSSLCMSPDNTGDGSWVEQLPCGTSLSRWVFKGGLILPSQLATLQANHSGQCMATTVGGLTSSVTQQPCSGVFSEQWSIIPLGGAYQLRNADGMCLDVLGGLTATDTQLIQYSCGSGTNQLFNFLPNANGSYALQAVRGGLCLDLKGGLLTPGAGVTTQTCSGLPDQQWSLSNATVPSSWTRVFPLNVNPIQIANLPNGNLITWSTASLYSITGDDESFPSQTYTSLFDPVAMISQPATITTSTTDMFCPGIANLPDGRILVNGGASSPLTTIYNPATSSFTVDAHQLNIWRGYNGSATLSNGSVFTLGGSWSGNAFDTGGKKSGEVWSDGKGWTLLTGVPDPPFIGPDPNGNYRGDNHMWLFAQSGGKVFHAGPSAAMHWIDTSGTGAVTSAGNRGDDPYSINGNAVMYDVGRILKTGGAPAYDRGTATTSTYTIDINNGVTVTKTAPMTFARAFSSGVALPTGQVLIVGGQTVSVTFTDTNAILTPELWDPSTKVFQQLKPMQTPRTYHSTAILLPDARVFVGGGGQCEQGCAANHFNTEILTPPYLLNSDGSLATRPKITSVASQVSVGAQVSVATDTPVVSFALMRLSSITHTVNNEQRRVPLTIENGSGTTYTLRLPSDPGVVVPGYYMLFALNAQDVPSVAATIQIQ